MPSAAAESSDRHQVSASAEFLFRVAERFGLPVVILVLVLWWARNDIVQPLVDAHFAFIREIVDVEREHKAEIEKVGRKIDELIQITRDK